VSSFLFGLWHIYPSLGVSALRIPVVGEVPQLIVVTAICTATFFAGLLFCFMKLKTDNLLTPILGHWFINAYGIFFAVLAWRQ
jgi:membrane protease YdiL (CAAX protease family)